MGKWTHILSYSPTVHGFAETMEERDGTAMVKLVADALAAALPRYLKAAEGQSHA